MMSRLIPLAWAPSLNLHPWNLPRHLQRPTTLKAVEVPASSVANSASFIGLESTSLLQTHISNWMSTTSIESSIASTSNLLSADRPPTDEEIKLLQNAFAAFYGAEKDVSRALELLTKTIDIWESTKQGGDEIAGLFRVRGDAYMELMQFGNAEKDYGKAVEYLDGKDGDKADPEERPAARLGRARAVRSMGSSATSTQATQASKDYELYFNYVSRLGTDDELTQTNVNTLSETIIDGIQRNPYAAWEWGMVNRVSGQFAKAAEIHHIAANAFEEIGDKPRATICRLDEGIDLASGVKNDDKSQLAKVKAILVEAIDSTPGVDGRDVLLLQRVVAKEGEGRIALSGLLWVDREKGAAESQFGTACARLDELNADYNSREQDRVKKGDFPIRGVQRLGFSIDDIVGADEASCSRFKNDKFIDEKLVWSESLRSSVKKFLTLSK